MTSLGTRHVQDIDFLIIGAAKSATTWLQRALQTVPDVAMPDPELHYFSREFVRGDDWYLAQFPASAALPDTVVGEKSNSYLDEAKAPARIARAMPQVRLIVQMRDPVARAYSDYCMLYRRGEVSADIAAHLDPRVARDGRFLTLGRYDEQLARYGDRFDAGRLLALTFEATTARPLETLTGVHDFLGLPAPIAARLPGRVKDKRANMIAPWAKRWLAPFKPLAMPLRGTRGFEALNARITAPIDYPELGTGLRARLADHFAPHNERLSARTGLDLSSWTAPESRETDVDPVHLNALSSA